MSGLQIFSMIASIALLVAAAGGLGFSIYQSILLVNDKRVSFDKKPYLKKIGISVIVFIIGLITGLCFIYGWNGYTANGVEWTCAILGTLVFATSFGVGLNSFIIHYYGKGLEQKLDKTLFICLVASIPLAVIGFFLSTNGFADMCGPHFLFPTGLNFTQGFVRPDSGYKANIAFYAVCILSGAVFVYFLNDHYMYKEYGKHGLLESTFLLAFPAGILGARIAYVIGNFTKDGFAERIFQRGEWWCIFAIWEGGLTILGGAIAGILVGMLVFIKVNKGRSLRRAIDLVVPTILIAQAIGRWGNFFNCEVHGLLVDEAAWSWLPKIVFNNMHYSTAEINGVRLAWAPEGQLYLPLFFIEFITNLLGYFVLAHVFGKRFKSILAPADLGAGYLIWYGMTRILLEPLRHPAFKMGEKDFWSWIWAIAFVVVGCLLIGINHVVCYLKNKKKGKYPLFSLKQNLISGSSLAVCGLALVIVSIVLLTTSSFVASLEFNNFNVGLILLSIGLGLCFLATPCFLEFFDRRNKEVVTNA